MCLNVYISKAVKFCTVYTNVKISYQRLSEAFSNRTKETGPCFSVDPRWFKFLLHRCYLHNLLLRCCFAVKLQKWVVERKLNFLLMCRCVEDNFPFSGWPFETFDHHFTFVTVYAITHVRRFFCSCSTVQESDSKITVKHLNKVTEETLEVTDQRTHTTANSPFQAVWAPNIRIKISNASLHRR